MLRVNRQDLQPKPEPQRQHPATSWRMIEGAAEAQHPLSKDRPNLQGDLEARKHRGGRHFDDASPKANQNTQGLSCK